MMMKAWRATLALVASMFILGGTAQAQQAWDLENTLYMQIPYGRVVIEMRPDLAPNHVARIKDLVRQKFYDGVPFHRVIRGFMAQTGDPTGTGMGGSGRNIDAEFSNTLHVRGTVSMARSGDPDSADSQFFICLERAPHLNGKYTGWGQVVEGMRLVEKIKEGSSSDNGRVDEPDRVIAIRVAADVESGAEELPTRFFE